MTPSEQIIGYLKLTSAHYYLQSRHYPSLALQLRSLLASEMDYETFRIARDLVESMTAFQGGFAA